MINTKCLAVGQKLGTLLGGSILTCSILISGMTVDDLQASTDEQREAAVSLLPRPRDMNADLLDDVDDRLQPQIAILWDPSNSADARLQAAKEIEPVITGLLATDEHRALGLRLQRRILVITATLQAGQAPIDVSRPTAARDQVRNSAVELQRTLRRIRNGRLWVTYLNLDRLQEAEITEESLAAFRERATISDELDEAQRIFAARPDIQELNALAEAAVAELTRPVDDTTLRDELLAQLDQLLRGFLQDQVMPVSTGTAEARSAWRVIRAQFPQAADVLRPALNSSCLGHNVHVGVSETLVSRLVAATRQESGEISEYAMGARITGDQVTSVEVSADIVSSADSALLNFVLEGTMKTDTVARKSPATVFSEGNHSFRVSKLAQFGGPRIELEQAVFSADINNRVKSFQTDYDGRLFGRVVRREAGRRIAGSQGATNNETRRQIRSEIVPRFEEEVSAPFNDLNQVLQNLESRGLGPDQVDASSDEASMNLSLRSIGTDFLGGSSPPWALQAGDGASVQLHQSVFNLMLGGLGLQGRVIDENELTGEIEKALSELLGREISLGKAEAEATAAKDDEEDADSRQTSFVFSDTDPLRVQFNDGEVSILIQTGIRQEGRSELAVHTIVIPIEIGLTEAGIELSPQRVRVLSAPITVANQLRKVIGSRIEEQQLVATLNLPVADGETPKSITVTDLQVQDGWLMLSIR